MDTFGKPNTLVITVRKKIKCTFFFRVTKAKQVTAVAEQNTNIRQRVTPDAFKIVWIYFTRPSGKEPIKSVGTKLGR